jgi:hypothetical protein
MKNVPLLSGRRLPVLVLAAAFIFPSLPAKSQKPVTSILTSSSTNSVVTNSNIKGAGLRNPSTSSLISYWDSTGSNFTVKFNAPAAYNQLTLTQFTVSGINTPIIKLPVSCLVKIRRLSNPDVGDARNYYNFWAQYSSVPASGATSGTFNFSAPEVLIPENAFLTNNLNSGYDNIFQNTIADPHFGNIERVDFIIPAGIKPTNDTDRVQSGVIVIDRGVGDPFKIAAITAVNASNDPVSYGPLVSVATANFGDSLLSSRINYGILIRDVKYNNGESRPSTMQSQNLRGVFMSLYDLGIANGQSFYGYSLFGYDVVTANPDWTTYPNNSDGPSQLDPVNVMGVFKSTKSVLAVPLSFSVAKVNQTAKLNFTVYNKISSDEVIAERSTDGKNFTEIGRLNITATGTFFYTDPSPADGENFYRLKLADKDGASGNTETKLLKFAANENIKTYPNPATSVLHIDLPQSWLQKKVVAELWNAAGQMVQKNILEQAGKTETIGLNNLQPGFYQLRLVNDNNTLLQSVTIMK